MSDIPADVMERAKAVRSAVLHQFAIGRPIDHVDATIARALMAERERAVPTVAAHDVLAERRRQIDIEGWTADHDDQHGDGAIAAAAASYAESSLNYPRLQGGWVPRLWRWDTWLWKPTNRRRDLVKAGALILAEIERLDRAALAKAEGRS